MKGNFNFLIVLLIILMAEKADWIVEKHPGYTLNYQNIDRSCIKEYIQIIDTGIKSVQTFFDEPYKSEFGVFIHPNRISIDNQWRKDWKIPDFKSECWMVASGVAGRLDFISPRVWLTEACEHNFSDKQRSQQLITHELVHVFHGQYNKSPDFSDVTGLDWFVEGLATYASGQCDSLRIAEIKTSIRKNEIPSTLDNFWTGNLKYGLSGSMVMYIDIKFGRTKLRELLKSNRKAEILSLLGISETELLKDWRSYFEK